MMMMMMMMITVMLVGQHARVFGITEAGELFLSDLTHLTGPEAHIVVTAEDSGSPPRRASVPVLVRFASSVASPRELGEAGPDTMLVIVLCSVSTVLIIIILGLAGVICRHHRLGKSSSGAGSPVGSSDSDSMYLQQHFPSQIGELSLLSPPRLLTVLLTAGHVNLSYKLEPGSALTSRSLHSTATRPSSATSDR